MANLADILKFKKFTPADMPELEGKLFFEGDRKRQHVVQIFFLEDRKSVV